MLKKAVDELNYNAVKSTTYCLPSLSRPSVITKVQTLGLSTSHFQSQRFFFVFFPEKQNQKQTEEYIAREEFCQLFFPPLFSSFPFWEKKNEIKKFTEAISIQ